MVLPNLTRVKIPFNLPWYMFDLYNKQLITTKYIPTDITDTKNIIFSETPIPGLNFNPINTAGMGNRKISFTLPLIKKNNTIGNLLLLKQFDNLRNQAFGMNFNAIARSQGQFTPNPKVLYFWGSGSGVPLEFFVTKCDFIHKSQFVNSFGNTQYSEVSIELTLDETSPLYKAEEVFRKAASLAGFADSTITGGIGNFS